MGVPKFFRYISERYPCLSEVVREYQLPEFDTLYLDMNGIIHVCSHPNDTDPHFRITEEKIFRDIFHYIESLFRMIQPQKLFFMAVDGVAPRAKMNQQRGRRFRSAKEAEQAEQQAKLRGEQLPTAERFDSNCITPGTEFMTRLHAQLKYFVTFKISTDKLWQKVKVILSGHETPGEGEHKIMDYIRYMKSQPGYDPNTRHCLYGLDADLIMLGLCTHEPHFSLLREEVKYGKKNNQKRIPTPEETTFFLLHLSLMREYLGLEFQQLKTTLTTFSYDLEHIIDDWVLMGFLVGNDFIPHLPELHINKGALPILYRAYIDVLPTLGGYINEEGTLRLDRFQKYLEKLAEFDFDQFKKINSDLRYFEAKTGRKAGGQERHSYKIIEDVYQPPKNKDLAALIASTEELLEGSDDDSLDSDDDDEEGTTFAEFCAHKNNYYIEKLEYAKVTPEVLRSQGEGYVRAIQWNLNYYYNGCCSWSWFYPHHYAPFISDIKNFSDLKLEFDKGKPFLPFQQLLAVLPAASKKLLPEAYHDLMVNDESPIIHFYPTDFKTDLNGKIQEWEAVVLIPFIEQDSLVQAMETKEDQLSEEERSRNKHGPMHVYTYTPENLGSYLSPAYFPALANHHAKLEDIHREQLHVDKSKLVRGLCPGAQLDVYHPGFPTFRHIAFTAELRKAKVKVFESASQGDNMILTILPQGHPNVNDVARAFLGKSIFVNWPHLYEARVVGVSNERKRFKLDSATGSIITDDMTDELAEQWNLTRGGIEEKYFNRMGIDIGTTEILVYACTLEDSKYVLIDDKLHFEKQWSRTPVAYALQTTRTDIAIRQEPIPQNLTVEHLFPPGISVFSLDPSHYGCIGTVVESVRQRVKVRIDSDAEPNLEEVKYKLKKKSPHYKSGNSIAQRIGITPLLLSRITGTIFVMSSGAENPDSRTAKINIGLNLKFNKRNEEVCGYSRKDAQTGYWLYSPKAEKELLDYITTFPNVLQSLEENNGQDLKAKDLFPEETESKMGELRSWLKALPSASAERQTCGAQVLEEEVVLALEEYIDNFMKHDKKVKSVTLNVKPSSLYLPKPRLGQAPDPNAIHKLFDRIINIRESHTVPLGARGTIIGIHDENKGPKAMYDIVFDKEFTGGLKLRSSPHRGYRLPGQAFINITFGQNCDNNRTPGKPTAVVEPSSGAKEEVRIWKNGGPNSAFASWRSPAEDREESPIQTKGRRPSDNQHKGPETPSKSKHHQFSWANAQKSAPQQLSNEYLAMFNQLQKASPNTKGQLNKPTSTNAPAADPSSTLKKMLKIADDASRKVPDTSRRVPSDTSRKAPALSDMHSPMKTPNNTNYCMQLLSLHQKMGRAPKFLYSDTKEGTIICTVICYNGKEYQGAPLYTNDMAAESAAHIALQCLAIDDQWSPFGYHPNKKMPLLMNSPQRPAFGPSMRGPMRGAPQESWREPAKPSTLPHPPTNWYQNSVPNYHPDWRTSGSAVRKPHQNFYSPPSQYHNQFAPPVHNQFGQFNQFGQMSARPPQRNPFIPLQAESRTRQQPQSSSNKPQDMPKPMAPSEVKNPSQSSRSSTSASGRSSTRPIRPRIAANFNNPINFDESPNQ